VAAWPQHDSPELFGMHANAEIAVQAQQSRQLTETILSVQPRLAGGASCSTEDASKASVTELLASIPAAHDISSACKVRAACSAHAF